MLAFLFNSSTDPEQLSATVSGLILSCSALIVFGAAHFSIVLGDAQVSALATEVGLAAGTLWTLFGIVRKIVMIFKPAAPSA
jgi:hypothetical protein